MALHFHKLKVKNIRKETSDCVSIAFDIPDQLKNDFVFKQGQNITIKSTITGEEIRRSYSICSSPLDNELRIGVKKVTGGAFSSFANQKLKEGDVLDVLPPTGTFFTEVNILNKKNYVFFAAGSGITPVISIIKTILLTEPESYVTLVYGNKNVSSIIFKEQLEALKDKYLQRFRIYYVLSRERTEADINYGRIDAEKCRQFSRLIDFKFMDEFFICGPEGMIFTVKEFLENKGVEDNKIHFELFITPTRKNIKAYSDVKEKKDEGSEITVTSDGRSFNFKLDYDSNTILDAALAQGADLPFACKGGVCTTCKAKLIEGKVEMEVNYGLEPDEVKAGFVLTCQSHPRSEKVFVDFDNK
ncbi:phenylacetate-CoA oxygenase/reductase subunit PaaK [Ginsengibacter hankyongi]|uniref:Phenylacetate-CoA oxygenase/reductase subunit PaaK n=1 Tax=Ginsengibacter hankyongi TaxID=2607284 RepID=A0A5J5IMX6_9BACT|nr:1,2-phenylacetyl-CoA epoxidase subunit PaaE [Ginsengibacter hankyongi]KAA9042081.1 phenylacetate-CoA oxygenase/reductase subunit PaaK [Ginsengibacter hankyongi]